MTNCNNIIDGEDEDDEGDDGAQDGGHQNDDDRAQDGDDDNDDAGDPWQQYMAAQMAVGGGYSPHMYSHRWAIASILTTTTNTTIITSTNTNKQYFDRRSYSSLLLQSRPREWGKKKLTCLKITAGLLHLFISLCNL